MPSAGLQASPSVPRFSKSQAQSFVRLNPRPLCYKEGNSERERMISLGLGFPAALFTLLVSMPENLTRAAEGMSGLTWVS